MQHVQEANLAWSLIDVAKPYLDALERNHVFVCVGAGDSFTAIRILLKLIAVKQIPLSLKLVQLCTGWLEAYVLHDDHDRLRVIVDSVTVCGAEIRPLAIVRSRTHTRNAAALEITPQHRVDAARAG